MPTVMMTGGHAGIGLVAARTLATRHGCDLILTGRSLERVETAAADLRHDTGRRIDVVQLDLASLPRFTPASWHAADFWGARAAPASS